MFPRSLSLLLVPLMLVNQGLCFAHAHHGSGFAEPDGHGARLHFHLSGRDDSESGHRADQLAANLHREHTADRPVEHEHARHSEVAPVGEHDADAVYFAESAPLAREGRSISDYDTTDGVAATIFREIPARTSLRLEPGVTQRLSSFDAACPVYLRTLSLRL